MATGGFFKRGHEVRGTDHGWHGCQEDPSMTSHPRRLAGSWSPPAEVRILPLTRGNTRFSGPTVSPHELLADLAAAVDVAPGGGETATPVCLTLDVPTDLEIAAERGPVRRLFAPLLERALAAAGRRIGAGPSPREVVVTAVGFPDRIEIEFADSGPGLTHRERSSFPPQGTPATDPREPTDPLLDDLRHRVVALGGSISAIDCPEGGSAVTLCLPTRPAALRRAA